METTRLLKVLFSIFPNIFKENIASLKFRDLVGSGDFHRRQTLYVRSNLFYCADESTKISGAEVRQK